MKPKTAEQHNREMGVATTGKELPSIPDTLKRIAEVEKTQEALLKKLADVDLAISQARQETAREIFEEIEKLTMRAELGNDNVEVQVIRIRDCDGIDKDWQDLKKKYG